MSVEGETPPPWEGRRAERAAAWVAAGASLLFALVAFWELFGPLPGGHLGNASGAAIAGENMLVWKVLAAVLEYTPRPPSPSEYYCHHPYGVFLLEALAHRLVGHSWATVRLPAAVLSALCPLLMYRLGKALWGAVPAAVATVAFCVVPIDLAFANFHNLEGVTIAFGLLFSWATARLWQTWEGRYLAPAVIGAIGACHGDWVGLVLVGTVGLFAFARAYALPERAFGHVDQREHARWFGWVTAAAVGSLLLYLALFAKTGKLADFLQSGEARSSGASAPFASIFGQRRRMWVLWMLPWPALVSIASGPFLWAARLLKEPALAIPFGWLLAASFQYFVFRQGADVHIFWPHYFGPVAALGAGALAHAALSGVRLAAPRLAPGKPEALGRGAWLVLIPLGITLALVGRVGLTLAYQSRLTGGRFDDGGRFIAVDQDRSQFAAWAAKRMPPVKLGAAGGPGGPGGSGGTVLFHRSFPRNWYVEYGLRRPVQTVMSAGNAAAPGDDGRFLLLDARSTAGPELTAVAERFSPEAVGPYWLVDKAAGPGGLRALRYDERQPSLWSRYFVTGSDLVRTIGPGDDPFATYEWRSHLGLPTQAPPAPQTADEARVAHNAALDAGDAGLAASLRPRVEAAFARRMDVPFSNDVRLVALSVDEGPATVVSFLWETGPAFQPTDNDFLVRSRVVAAPPLWPSAVDFFEKEMAPPIALRPSLWKPGRLYLQRFVAMRRVGRERFEGLWTQRGGPSIKPLSGQERVELFTLR